MSEREKVQLPWQDIDTLLLDMDGTLLDLAFDNFFWNELVPAEFARVTGRDPDAARDEIRARTGAIVGTLPWYCLDHWTRELGLDIAGLKRAHRHGIRYLPQARDFLDFARRAGKTLILVTNAHRVTLEIKCEQTGVDRWMHGIVSSHDFGVVKEDVHFWQRLAESRDFSPDRALLLEDNLAVLAAAQRFGIAHTVAITRPDTTQAPREAAEFRSVTGVASLIDEA